MGDRFGDGEEAMDIRRAGEELLGDLPGVGAGLGDEADDFRLQPAPADPTRPFADSCCRATAAASSCPCTACRASTRLSRSRPSTHPGLTEYRPAHQASASS